MNILLVNNYDSFTFNLYQYLGEIFEVAPCVVNHDDVLYCDIAEFDAVVISPGPGNPQTPSDLGISLEIVERAEIPILGICLGHQVIVHCSGGIVKHANEPRHGYVDDIYHDKRGIFSELPSPFNAVRYHSLAGYDPLPENLNITARTGDGIIMAVEDARRPVWGVQFHPESAYTSFGRELLKNFRDLALPYKNKNRVNTSYNIVSLNQLLNLNKSSKRIFIGEFESHINDIKSGRWKIQFSSVQVDVSPDRVFETLYGEAEHAVWLDSSAPSDGEKQFSYFGDDSGRSAFNYEYFLTRNIKINGEEQQLEDGADFFNFIEVLSSLKIVGDDLLPFDFYGGVLGYFGYELQAITELTQVRHVSTKPDAAGIFATRFIVYDHKFKRYFVVSLSNLGHFEVDNKVEYIENEVWSKNTLNTIASLADAEPVLYSEDYPINEVIFTMDDGKPEYLRKIQICKEHIRNGETYEVCLTNRIRTKVDIDALQLYQVLRRVNPAPRSAYIRHRGLSILSCSPETFVTLGREGLVSAKPIKGTRRRLPNPREDERIKQDLATNKKDFAENLMITDLLRNDLNRVCSIGSVDTPKLMEVETFKSVHQLVSTISGKILPELKAVDLFKATFPPGSMTGAPKKRTLSIIDSLEDSARGVYSGSIGYFSGNGIADLNVVIRTVLVESGELEIGVGGAVIHLSDPDEEFDETLVKAHALMKGIALCATGNEQNFSIFHEGRKQKIDEIMMNDRVISIDHKDKNGFKEDDPEQELLCL